MTELPHDGALDGELDAVRGAQAALGGSTPPDTFVLQAVEAGLLSVPAGAAASWIDVPHQRPRQRA
ncbi:hypothetical protein [Cellulomonas composti]|uniref:Uncharacterized protein n=1 Tax=Cellulomonas composti TaxID=266130 RepID=A0A511J841_9CELL|nr:hypothetical protein [Cellulomonas composti]GEL94170.1 hypothetical protein CCO02nite_08280 [Cellulomonas composti]